MSVVELVPAIPRATTESSLELAAPAYALAERIAKTDFVPAALRGKPEAVLAAILTGHELGIAPMQSLSKIHVIEGRPAMSAELMRALVLAAGHDVWVIEATTTKCTVGAKRRGSDRESTFTWTLDDANRAGLDGRQNWRKFPRAMLLARATAEAVRAVFPDVIAGLSYSVEELEDGFDFEEQGAGEPASSGGGAAPRRRARASRAATANVAASAPPPAAIGAAAQDFPPLPDEPLDVGGGGGDGTAEADTVSRDPHPSPPPDDEGPIDAGPTMAPANAIAMWCRECSGELHPDLDTAGHDEWRHAFLAALGGWGSSHDVPGDQVAALRASLVRLRRGELRLDRSGETPVLRLAATGLPSSDPAGEHRRSQEPTLDFSKLKVAELAALCRERGIEPAGSKAELVALLEGAEGASS